MASKIRCADCEYCEGVECKFTARSSFYCQHPDKKHIYDYFKKHRMRKSPGLIGTGEPFLKEVPVKTSPAWCPKKKSEIVV